jgi:2-polyprenyl-3-methyl-5-hydroxy-6-metoxy-1,4-benzoquinol methylase
MPQAAAREASEHERVTSISGWYLRSQLDFDRRMIHFRYLTLRGHLAGPDGLELGPAEGEMTQFLLPHFERLTVVDGAADLLACIPEAPNLTKVHALFEEFEPRGRFDCILMEHILEHVADPPGLLRRARGWLKPGGKVLLGVPNGHSLHRLAAVKMGLLQDPCELNARDHSLGHRRVYTRQALARDVEAGGLRAAELGGVFLKPLSNQQIQDHWTEEMIQGFFRLGADFPGHAAELYAVCEAA